MPYPFQSTRNGLIPALLLGCVLLAGCGDDAAPDDDAPQQDAAAADPQSTATDPPGEPYIPPADHLEPFAVSFGFGNPDKVAHFWGWSPPTWTFTEEHARNNRWNNYTALFLRYELVGDFEVTLSGRMSRSYTNSKRPHLHIAGQQIRLNDRTRAQGLEVSVRRVGQALVYSINGSEPTTVDLDSDQAGPTPLRIRWHNRHMTLNRITIKADAADRITGDAGTQEQSDNE